MENNYAVKILLLLIVMIFPTSGKCSSDISDYPKSTMNRLPKAIEPKFYELHLLTQLKSSENFTYNGHVKIDINVLTKTNSIVLNVDELNIIENKTILKTFDNQSVTIIDQKFDIEKQFYITTLLNDIQAGNYSLDLFFIGEIRDDVFGFYRSSSKDGNETRYV